MSQPENDFEDSLPKKTGMSTTTKVVLVMLSVGGVALLLCCGGLMLGGWYFARQVQNSISTNPVQIQQMTDQIVSIDIPEGYEPKQSMTMDMFGMKMSTYGRSDDPRTMLMIMQNRMAFNANDEQQRKAMLDQMRMQMGMQVGAATDVETKEIDINGEKIPFQFGKLDQQGQTLRQVMGLVPLKTGAVLIMLIVSEEHYDEDEIVAMLESIREPDPTKAGTDGVAPPPPTRVEAESPPQTEEHAPQEPGEPVNAERPEPVSTPE